MNQQQIVAAARGYLGVRFLHQGRTRQGMDCLGLLLAVARDCQFAIQGIDGEALRVPNYSWRPDTDVLQAKLSYYLEVVESEAMPTDIVLLRVNGAPQHLAIIGDYPEPGERSMIHAYAPARKVVEHRYDRYWQSCTHQVYRVPQLS